MANEITVVGGDGRQLLSLLLLYPIATPATYIDADSIEQTIIETPSAGLPTIGAAILTIAEKAALDAGTLAFEVVPFGPDPGLNNPQLLASAQDLYARKRTAFELAYARRYWHLGDRFDGS